MKPIFKIKLVIKTIVLMLALISTQASLASEAMLRQFFIEVKTLQANFEQRVTDETGFSLENSSGTFSLSRPGKFRWDYLSDDPDLPIGQQIIADGEFIYLFAPDLEQVTRRSLADALGQVPSLVLVQSGADIDKYFVIGDIGLTDGLSWVSLQPKDENAGYQQLLMGFEAGVLATIELVDGLANVTRLTLSGVRTNIKLPTKRFNFEVPDGVDFLSE